MLFFDVFRYYLLFFGVYCRYYFMFYSVYMEILIDVLQC